MDRKRTAIVTGASRGLGAAIAVELAAAGLKVAVNYCNSAAAAERVCEKISAAGGIAAPFKADIRDEGEVARLAAQVRDSLGEIDTIVLNATGHQPMPAIEEQTWRSYLEQLEYFVKSPLLLLQQVLPAMKRNKFGRVVQIGSEVVELGNPQFANYVAAKGAQLGQTRSWARELAPHGITVNLVAPGWILTERHRDAKREEMDAYIAAAPMQRMGQAADVGRAVAYLCSEAACFVTGQKIAVNGGNTLL